MPLAALNADAIDTSIVCSTARPDNNGLVCAATQLTALHWNSTDAIYCTVTDGILVFTRAPSVHDPQSHHPHQARRQSLHIPARIRTRLRVAAGNPILLVAIVDHDVILAYPHALIARMLIHYHHCLP